METPPIRRGKDVVFHSAVAGEEVELKEGWTREGVRSSDLSLAPRTKRQWWLEEEEEDGEDAEEKMKREDFENDKQRLQQLQQHAATLLLNLTTSHPPSSLYISHSAVPFPPCTIPSS